MVNGAWRVPDAIADLTFGVVPLGTGNDFARTLGLTTDVDTALDRLVVGSTRQVDVAWLDERAFINSSAGGLLAEASERVGPGLKTLAGRLAYLIGGAQTAWEYEAPTVSFALDGAPPVEARVDVMVVGNARTLGGGHALTPDARIDDGTLDLLVIRESSLANLTRVLLGIARGEVEDDPSIWRASVRELAFTASREMVVNTDGAPRRLTHGRYRLQPRAARFLC